VKIEIELNKSTCRYFLFRTFPFFHGGFAMRAIAFWSVCILQLSGMPAQLRSETITAFPVFDRSASDFIEPGAMRDGLFDTFWNDDNSPNVDAFQGLRSEFETRGALEFLLGQVPKEAAIDSAILFLQTTGRGLPPSETGVIRFDGYAGNGTADLADFSAENPLATRPAMPPFEQHLLAIDVTGFVRDLNDVNATHAGFTMRASPGISYSVASSEYSFEPWRPRLEITYSPIPEATGVALILAAVGLAVAMRTRKRTC
jgi:hypothetical protein